MADSINEPLIGNGLFTFEATSSTVDGSMKEPEFVHPRQAPALFGRATIVDGSGEVRKRQGNLSRITSSKRLKSEKSSVDHSRSVADVETANYETNDDLVTQDIRGSGSGDCTEGLVFCDVLPESGQGDASQRSLPIADIVKELGQDGKMLYAQWIQIFDDSENFEQFCPARLDKVLEEAMALEESLKQQKEILCRRLQGLSQTLQML